MKKWDKKELQNCKVMFYGSRENPFFDFLKNLSSNLKFIENLDSLKTESFDLCIIELEESIEEKFFTCKETNQKVIGIVNQGLSTEKLMSFINLGIDKFFTTPFNEVQILATFENFFSHIYLHNELEINFKETVISLINLLEDRDSYTGGHSQRVALYAQKIAIELGLNAKEVDNIYQAGILHDIGKVAVPDTILLKPDRLSFSEYDLVKQHVDFGVDVLDNIPLFGDLVDIVSAHHERLDGTGYPKGLKGDEIPLGAQILAVCDCFDAMTTRRIYKKYKTKEDALKEIESLKEKHFLASVVEAAVRVFDKIYVDESINQHPTLDIEHARFSYYFKDQVTKLFNYHYLDFVLQENVHNQIYKYLAIVSLKQFHPYNEQYGWEEGNNCLYLIARELEKRFVGKILFKIKGDDFIILSQEPFEELLCIEELTCKKNLRVKVCHFEVAQEGINSFLAVDALYDKHIQCL